MSQERALFATAAQNVTAGATPAAAPTVSAGRLYEVKLSPQPVVTFAAPPAKKMLSDGAYAGVVSFTVTAAGVYRISLDQPFWLDVAANGELLRSKDFQGRAGCNAPHKVVEFDLPAATPLVLQLSGGTSTTLKVTITPAPVKAP
ncbi:MAG: hypothetical protein NTZ79_01735 [Proteobacteria bacterium]|nr:hypothetical protein [Pseudomonadota bacterium]